MSTSEELYRKYNPMQAKEEQMGIDAYDYGKKDGSAEERERIIKLLTELGAIRRDALGLLCAFNTEGTEVIYLPGLEPRE
jgi:hypothetical protein